LFADNLFGSMPGPEGPLDTESINKTPFWEPWSCTKRIGAVAAKFPLVVAASIAVRRISSDARSKPIARSLPSSGST